MLDNLVGESTYEKIKKLREDRLSWRGAIKLAEYAEH